jgi:enterochelin esterase-like enzyme
MIGFMNESFPDGVFGAGDIDTPTFNLGSGDVSIDIPDLNPTGDAVRADIESPALRPSADAAAPTRHVLVYRPPAFFHGNDRFPVVYFLGGFGQEPDDFARMQQLFDLLILSEQIQNMYFVFLPGDGGRIGSFYVNHVVPESQAPAVSQVTSGRYEDSILQDLIPAIENQILDGRVRQ